MPFPEGFPPPPPHGVRSYRFYAEGEATDSFEDNAYLFESGTSITPVPDVPRGSTDPVVIPPNPQGTGSVFYAGTIHVYNDGEDALELSFDGTSVHGKLLAGEQRVYRDRHEGCIALRGAGVAFRVEAW